MTLGSDYFQTEDVVALARDLLGKQLFSRVDGVITGGMIVETEAYRAPEDKASHAYGMRRTKRTKVLYQPGGIAYVYLCYGIHHLLNFVTAPEGLPHAVLIRAIEPLVGVDEMLKRRSQPKVTPRLCTGPGTVTQALGITLKQNAESLAGRYIWVEEGVKIPNAQITAGPRIGIDYAEEWKDRPWRFWYRNNMIPLLRKEVR